MRRRVQSIAVAAGIRLDPENRGRQLDSRSGGVPAAEHVTVNVTVNLNIAGHASLTQNVDATSVVDFPEHDGNVTAVRGDNVIVDGNGYGNDDVPANSNSSRNCNINVQDDDNGNSNFQAPLSSTRSSNNSQGSLAQLVFAAQAPAHNHQTFGSRIAQSYGAAVSLPPNGHDSVAPHIPGNAHSTYL